MTKKLHPAQVNAICDREIATSTDPVHKAKVRFMRDYLTDPHFRAAVEAFITQRAVAGAKTLQQERA